MRLYELPKGTEHTIRCKQKDLIADLKAHIVDIKGELILLDLIRSDGKVVDFSSPNVELITIYEDGKEMPKAWTRCKIQRRELEGKQYHILATPNPSVRINRRKVSRVVLDVPCKLTLPSQSEQIDGVVHDLSGIGVGLHTEVKLQKQDFKHLRIEFPNDEVEEDEYSDEEPMIRLEANVIWNKEEQKGKKGFYYGCRLTHAEEALGYFMAAKMRGDRE